jgi:hypothetical protein
MPEINEIVDVTVAVQTSALSRQGFNSLMIIGSDSDFDAGFIEYEVRSYVSYAGVVADTDILDGSLKDKLLVAFAQIPAVPRVYVSRVDAGSAVVQVGDLVFSAPLVTGNNIAVKVNGVLETSVPFNTDNATTLTDIASTIYSLGQILGSVLTAVSDGTDTITITNAQAGDVISVTAIVTDGASQATALYTATTPAVGDVTSSDLDAIAANDNSWFGHSMVFEDDSSQLAAIAWCAANKKSGFYLRTEIRNIGAASNLSSLWITDSTYTGTARHLEVAVASRILSLTPGSYTTAYKSLELASTKQWTTTQETLLREFHLNQYSVTAGVNITFNGVGTNGGYIDLYIGAVYLEARMQEDVFSLMTSQNKIPMNNNGINQVANTINARLQQSIIDEYLLNDPQPVINVPLASALSAIDKSNRLLTGISFVAYASNAIQTIQINGTVVA